jgi:retinol dehydrogenase 12
MRNALVTGPSSGIGREVALGLAKSGFHVIAAGRSLPRVSVVIEEIRAEGGSAEFLQLDLASLASASEAAASLEKSGRSLSVLVNNAGVGITRGSTADGFQLQFGVNHLGHFMLTSGLQPTFVPGTRIISVSSHMHYRADGIDFDILRRPTRGLRGISAYAASKLANILFTRELARRSTEWRTFAVHPGVVESGIFPAPVRPFIRRGAVSAADAADTILWCAVEPSLHSSTGRYFASREERTPSDAALDDTLSVELWERSGRWCGVGPMT